MKPFRLALVAALALFALNVALAVPLFFVLDRGHLIAGSVAEEKGRA